MQIELTPDNEEALKAFVVIQGVGNPTGWGNKAIAEFLRLYPEVKEQLKKGNQNGRRKGTNN